MGRYTKIERSIWNDGKFNKLSDNGKLVFIFLLTHPHQTHIGAFRSNFPGLAHELGWTEKAFREAFREAFAKGIAKADEKAGLIWLPNFLKHNHPESPNVVKAWGAALDMLPECPLYYEIIQSVKAFMEAFPKAFQEALPKAFAKARLNQEQEQEQELEQKQEQQEEGLREKPKPKPTRGAQTKNEHAPPGGGVSESTGSIPTCSTSDVIRLYHEILPELPRVKKPDGVLGRALTARMRDRQCQCASFWENYFGDVRASAFLMGMRGGFRASLPWLVMPANFEKVLNGQYRDSTTSGSRRSSSNLRAAAEWVEEQQYAACH